MYTKNDNLAIREIENEIFIFDRDKSQFHTFNATGTCIWKNLKSNATINELSESLMNDFEIDKIQAIQDTKEFLSSLESKGLIRITNE